MLTVNNQSEIAIVSPNITHPLLHPLYTMVSIKTTFLALAAAVAVSADYYIVPDSVPAGTRSTSNTLRNLLHA